MVAKWGFFFFFVILITDRIFFPDIYRLKGKNFRQQDTIFSSYRTV